MALKKGICKNFDNCTLAEKPEIQEVDSSEFRCAECGKELYEYKEPPKRFPLKLILIIVAALLFTGGGICAYFGLFKDRPKVEESVSLSLNKEVITLYVGESDTLKATVYSQPEDANITVFYTSDNENVAHVGNNGVVKAIGQGEASITVIARMESGIADTALSKVIVVEKPAPPIEPSPAPKPALKELGHGWYTWSGNYIDGKPHGKGTMKITQTHTIDLVDITGSKITVYPGETIIAMFDHGRLRGGDIIHKDGSSTTFVNNI